MRYFKLKLETNDINFDIIEFSQARKVKGVSPLHRKNSVIVQRYLRGTMLVKILSAIYCTDFVFRFIAARIRKIKYFSIVKKYISVNFNLFKFAAIHKHNR